MKAQKWVLVHHFEGFPKSSDLELQEEDLPEVKENEVLLEAVYLSVDPYMRPYSKALPIGSTMVGEQVARVSKSKNPKFPEGSLVLAQVGWRSKTVVNPDKATVYPAWNTGDLPSSLALGAVGMPGLSAYFGLLKICEPKPGETLFVNSSAGIVGSTVGQIGKIKGCRVIGCAGSAEKCKMLTEEFGFDYVFNYKTSNIGEELKKGAPNGIDCYFDNVGGEMTTEVIQNHINRFGRIANCGVISSYNATEQPLGPQIYWNFVGKELKMQGFIVNSFQKEKPAASAELLQWVKEGKLKYKEEILQGFDKMFNAFSGLLNGSFTGKVLVKV